MSWTGTESKRREQGNCPASPIDAAASVPPWERDRLNVLRWEIPAGTPVSVRRLEAHDRCRFTEHATRVALQFVGHDEYQPGAVPVFFFRHLGYMIRVSARYVVRIDGGRPIRRQAD